ncbi:hypothetical protein [Xanthomonas hortorum]|uniref:hypothetical protein n=1 Tax=Xanthomonas hortorum TaxID=56454 RepID=UPI000CEDCC8F|nr:hypothetical protein [Xanthomonas hortorum]MCE4371799.1 hypothetical protein [Xanthomonas hortorum pv. hederae]PPU80333.1 hypothetical protein XhhCFBP4925_11955 [Xanthomonas hortorum pv. hederae]PUE99720.1 hypothetical protein C7T87_12350 [Xanthomonas hortorum pv. hederae]
MSATRIEVAGHGKTRAVLSTRLNSATHARVWIAEVYYETQNAKAIRVVAIVGNDGDQPSFEMPQHVDGICHCLWLGHSCVELPAASWNTLKAWSGGVMQGATSRARPQESRA